MFAAEEARRKAERRAQSSAFVAVCLRDTDQLIGNLYLGRPGEGQAERGYLFARDAWGTSMPPRLPARRWVRCLRK